MWSGKNQKINHLLSQTLRWSINPWDYKLQPTTSTSLKISTTQNYIPLSIHKKNKIPIRKIIKQRNNPQKTETMISIVIIVNLILPLLYFTIKFPRLHRPSKEHPPPPLLSQACMPFESDEDEAQLYSYNSRKCCSKFFEKYQRKALYNKLYNPYLTKQNQ